MSVYSTREIRRALLAKGFQEIATHHLEYRLMAGAKKTPIFTRLSHGAREYDDHLLGLMAKEMHLRRRELDAFLTHRAFLRFIRSRDALAPARAGRLPGVSVELRGVSAASCGEGRSGSAGS